MLRKAIAAEITTWKTIDSETSAPTRRATAAMSLPVASQPCRPVERVPIGATRQSRTAHAIGAIANAMYGVRHVPAVARMPATSGAAKNDRCPAVVCVPIAMPRREENISAMSAEAGA